MTNGNDTKQSFKIKIQQGFTKRFLIVLNRKNQFVRRKIISWAWSKVIGFKDSTLKYKKLLSKISFRKFDEFLSVLNRSLILHHGKIFKKSLNANVFH